MNPHARETFFRWPIRTRKMRRTHQISSVVEGLLFEAKRAYRTRRIACFRWLRRPAGISSFGLMIRRSVSQCLVMTIYCDDDDRGTFVWVTNGCDSHMIEGRSVAEAASKGDRTASSVRSPRQRARRTNNPCAGTNRRTAEGRRIADLVEGYSEALGCPNDVVRLAAIVKTAELVALAEKLRSIALADPSGSNLDQVVRAENAADRAVRRLGIRTAETKKAPSLSEYLASRQPSKAGQGESE